ncbi:glycosyltransferase [Marinobacter adhaerens]|uniref:Glycosyltransferase n=1 Tax=Marinobacter adhaerens TaxID=1033846 RepID=A0A851HNU5_9GAMM|nr:glycosyltransferase [Marinobacter adhaerens]NWN90420.1 glycosyltransferase [Marinobacter adhaerens]
MPEAAENTAKANLNGRNVLFIAYFYPPTESTGVPGSMRTVKFIRHLSGGDCHVLTTPPSVSADKDALAHLSQPMNAETIHRSKSVDVFKLLLRLRGNVKKLLRKNSGPASHGATTTFKSSSDATAPQAQSFSQRLKDFVYNLCYFPDQAGPWIFPASRKGTEIVKANNINAVFATGSPWSGLIVGYRISKATGVPLIVDFRDPWMNNPFHQSKGKFLDAWSKRLERKVVEHASAVSLNTQPLLEEFQERYPEQPTSKFFVMPNGFDESDFANVPQESARKSHNDITLCHAGFLYGVRDPAALLNVIREVNKQLKTTGSKKKLIFRQVGDIQLDYNIKDRYEDLIAEGSLQLDPPQPYLECLKALKSADIVVNIQPATRSQIPSKLYDYLAINQPILSITPANGALGKLITQKGLGEQADFDEVEKIKTILNHLIRSSGKPFAGYPDRQEFNVAFIAEELAACVKHLS